MSRGDIIGYTGEGMPPFCEMTLKVVPNKTTPPNLQFTVILDGFYTQNDTNTLLLTRDAEIVPPAALVDTHNDAEVGQLSNVMCFFIVTSLLMFNCRSC